MILLWFLSINVIRYIEIFYFSGKLLLSLFYSFVKRKLTYSFYVLDQENEFSKSLKHTLRLKICVLRILINFIHGNENFQIFEEILKILFFLYLFLCKIWKIQNLWTVLDKGSENVFLKSRLFPTPNPGCGDFLIMFIRKRISKNIMS